MAELPSSDRIFLRAAYDALDDTELVRHCATATPERPWQLEAALRRIGRGGAPRPSALTAET